MNGKFEFKTEKLIIRPFEQKDYDNWLTEHQNRLPAQHKYDHGKSEMTECTPYWFNEMIENHQQMIDKDQCYIFGIFLKENDRQAGTIDLSTLMRYDFQWGRIGYTIHNHFWRNGYGNEAVKGMIKFAFEMLGFHRIEAHINIDNLPSIKLAESVGMEYECIRRGFIFEFGEWTDNLVYYINND